MILARPEIKTTLCYVLKVTKTQSTRRQTHCPIALNMALNMV